MEAHKIDTDFCLAPGGPVDRLQEKLRLARPDNPRLVRRALITALVAWVPLLVAALLEPTPGVDVSFFNDIAAHARFLLIIPLLIVAEGLIGTRSRLVVSYFLSSKLIGDAEAARYEAAVKRGRRLLDSWVAELIIIAITAFLVYSAAQGMFAEPITFWFEQTTPDGSTLSWAGWWYVAVASPIFVFLLLRWAWRYIVWFWFLRRVAKLDLRLTGTHPDRVGGLGFVSFNQSSFSILTLAVACAVSAALANRILYGDATLMSFKAPLITIIAAAVLVGVAPMLVFTRRLVRAKHRSWLSYSGFASDYVWLFEQKWLGKGDPGEQALGSGDIQSLADLGGSFERVVEMRPVPIDRRLVLSFAIAAAAPILPLVLTMMPLRDIIRMLFKAMM